MKEDQCHFQLIWQTVLKTPFLGELSGDDSLLESSVVRSEDVIRESMAPRSVRFFFSRRNSLHVLLLLFFFFVAFVMSFAFDFECTCLHKLDLCLL